MSTASFGRSCAAFDPAGNLVDWDAGFASEFSVVATRIVAGASFREILRAALERDHVARLCMPKPGGTEEARRRIGRWPQDLGQENPFAYSNGERIVHVWESRTVAGGIIRAARNVTPQRLTVNAPEIEPNGAGGARGKRAEPGTNGQANLVRPAALQASNGMLVLRSHTERELIRVREAAQAAERTKSDFVSRISHEIRTPMNVVLGMAEILSETELSAEQRRYLEMMTANGNALLERIGSILDLARAGSGHRQIDRGSRLLSTAQPGRVLNIIAPTAELVPNLAGYRVLVVDDVQINRLIVREMLSGSGAEVSEAESGAAALAAIRNAAGAGQPYRIVALDMRMPGIDGSEVAARIRDESPAVRPVVMMLSSDDLRPEFTRLRELGLDAFLVKPITRKELFQTIRRVLQETNRDGAETPAGRTERPPSEASHEQPGASLRTVMLTDEESEDNGLLMPSAGSISLAPQARAVVAGEETANAQDAWPSDGPAHG